MRKITILMTMLFVLTGISYSFSQISISAGTTVTQNFDSLGGAVNATLPMGWKVDTANVQMKVKTFAGATNITMRSGGNNMSSTAGNGSYNFGAGDVVNATDRAIGGLSSGTKSKSVNIYTSLINNGTSNITDFTVSYDVEKYRQGRNAAQTSPKGKAFRIQMFHSTDGVNWTNSGNDFLTSFPADDTTKGYAVAPGVTANVVNKTLSMSVAPGSLIYLAWNYSVDTSYTSYSQALGIDNVSITANSGVPIVPSKLTITDVNSGSSPVRNISFSVTVQSTNTQNNPVNAINDIPFTLFVANGTGTLSGTYTGTIPSGGNRITLTGVLYDVAETAVTLYPRDNADTLLYDTCAPFNVLAVPVVPTRLKILSVNGGVNPLAGIPFAVVVQAQDSAGNVANVSSNVVIDLSKITGTGLLSGTLSDSILAGTNQKAITGIIYNTAESGVSIQAADRASLLFADTSALLTVDGPYPGIANIPTFYDWTPSTDYPTGWYNSGLSFYTTGHVAPNSGKFDNQGDNLVIHFNDSVTHAKFWLKKNSVASPYQFDILESVNGIAFTTLHSYSNAGDSLATPFTEYSLVPSPASRFIKFIYTTKSSGNIAIDEVSLTNSNIGITDRSANPGLSVRPNPGNGIFYLYTSSEGIYNLNIYNMLGEQLLSNVFNTHQAVLNLSGFEKGIYLVRLTEKSTGKSTTSKLIIN